MKEGRVRIAADYEDKDGGMLLANVWKMSMLWVGPMVPGLSPLFHSIPTWWMVHTTVLFFLARVLRASIILRATSESNPLVGSSAKITVGSLTNSTARLVRRF